MQAVQQEGEVGSALGRQAMILEAHVLAERLGRVPAVTERRIGDHRIEGWLLGWVLLAEHVPVVGQRVAVVYLELRILHPVQQHVHAAEVVGGDVLLLAVDHAHAAPGIDHAMADVQQQRARPAGKVHYAGQLLTGAGCGVLAVEGDDGREDIADALGRIELPGLLAGPGGELADQVLIGITQGVGIGRELRQPLGDLLDNRAEFIIARLVALAQLLRAEVDLREQPAEGTPRTIRSRYI